MSGDADGGETITIRKDFGIFMAKLYEQSARDVQWTTNQIIEGLTDRAERAEATLEAVRFVVGSLMAGDFMPTSAAVIRALYPSEAMVKRLTDELALP
jgi:hypothetical protein